jgi:hypothetical protein
MGLCKICTSPNRAAIDEALAAGESRRSIARRFGMWPSALTWHAQKKHPPAESLDAIGDEPVIAEDHRGSHDWVVRQARARGKRIDEILALTLNHDPFYFGSDADVRKAKWFAEAVVRRFDAQIKAKEAAGGKPHLRGLHYIAVTAKQPVLWPDGRPYENTTKDWGDLQEWAMIARWLGFADIEDFDDQRNAKPAYNAPTDSEVDEPEVSADFWPDWELPVLDATLSLDEWTIPNISVNDGYEPDSFLDESSLVGVFIEKSTMNDWLEPLCEDLHADLYVGSGTQSITNAARFIRRAIVLDKPAHLLVISDFDPTGRKMPIGASRHVDYRRRMPAVNIDPRETTEAQAKARDLWITVDQIALTPEQIDQYDLPRAPIKKTDPGIRRFQKLFGRGAVELDALEALKPGALQEIVSDAIDAYHDDDIGRKLSNTGAWVEQAISEAWDKSGPEIQDRLDKTRAKLDAIVAPIEKELKKLRRKLKDRLKASGIESELEEIRSAGQDAIDEVLDFVEGVLPDRPEPDLLTGLPDGAEHLFDTERGYFDNLESLRKFYPPDPSKGGGRKARRKG